MSCSLNYTFAFGFFSDRAQIDLTLHDITLRTKKPGATQDAKRSSTKTYSSDEISEDLRAMPKSSLRSKD